MKKIILLSALVILIVANANSQTAQKTYCNPINIDYGYTPIPNFAEWGRHRATADSII